MSFDVGHLCLLIKDGGPANLMDCWEKSHCKIPSTLLSKVQWVRWWWLTFLAEVLLNSSRVHESKLLCWDLFKGAWGGWGGIDQSVSTHCPISNRTLIKTHIDSTLAESRVWALIGKLALLLPFPCHDLGKKWIVIIRNVLLSDNWQVTTGNRERETMRCHLIRVLDCGTNICICHRETVRMCPFL